MMSKLKRTINTSRKITSSFFYRSNIKVNSDKKIITFTFDDVPESTFDNAIPILNRYDIKATFYVALSLIDGVKTGKGLFREDDLIKCLDSGHELGCHSYGHIHFYDTHSKKFIESDLKKNQLELQKIIPEGLFSNFSYPYGEQTISAKRIVSRRYASCRGTDNGLNIGRFDLNSLKGIKLYEHINTPESIYSVLNEFHKSGGWLIFYTHEVQEDFSSYGCSPKYLEEIVKKCLDMGFEIKSIRQTIDSFNLKKVK
jgi:peptidoglycan/xylan/chitin deacetylase (PgdA/CDA1 family)